jgi:hypothetical protein
LREAESEGRDLTERARREKRVEQDLRLLAARALVRGFPHAEVERLETAFD